ncbi:MAG: hypothetical protein ABIO76_01480 [Ginsengibacter sp.]
MEAQHTETFAGEYYLEGVRETASGFKLNTDHSFEFFFSYGALDRGGEGAWKAIGNQVIFNSKKPKGQSFVLASHKSVDDDFITIKILEENPSFLSGVYAIVNSGNVKLESMSEGGLIRFPRQPVDSIVLLFEFCAEKTAVFAFTNKAENYFEFRLDPSIMDVYFENVSLVMDSSGLSGQHPLLVDGEYRFIKKGSAE